MKKLLVLFVLGFSLICLVSCKEDESFKETDQYKIYALASESGYTGTYDDWLAMIKGEKGDKGDQGEQGPKGDKGDKGDTGETGAQGEQGPKGDKGDKGDTGETGAQGEQGPKGDKGDKGDTGETGAQGEQGPKGDKGDKGDTGETGAQGEKGDKGDKGETGETGAQGEQGPKGDKGDKGETGETGAQGEQGPKGDKGDKGDTGETGAQGEQGPKGDQGIQGVQGIQGPNGEKVLLRVNDFKLEYKYENDENWTELFDLEILKVNSEGESVKGDKGDKGDQGETGKSAYEIFKDNYPEYTGTELEWITAIAKGDVCSLFGHDYQQTALNILDGDKYKITYTCNVCGESYDETLDRPTPTTINVSGNSLLYVGFEGTLTPSVTPTYASEKYLWSTSDSNIITVTENGVIKGISEGSAVITCTSALDDKISYSFEITVTLKPATAISTILSSANGSYSARGTVVSTCKEGFLISDGTGYILIYKGTGFAKDLAIGDQVYVEGTTSTYSSKKQFSNSTTYKVEKKVEYNQPSPIFVSGSEFDNLKNGAITYVKFNGLLSNSSNNYNLTVDGATNLGRIMYPNDDLVSLVGKEVTVIGYYIYLTDSKYLNFMATSVAERVYTDSEYVEMTKRELSLLDESKVKEDMTLPTILNNCTIVWTSDNNDVISEDGKFTYPEEDTIVILTAVITKGEVTETLEMMVTALAETSFAEVTFDFVSNFSTYAKDWSSSYVSYTITSADLGISNYDASITLSRGSKQTTINDCPVVATGKSNGTVYVTITADLSCVSSATFNLKNWGTDSFTNIHIEYYNGTDWITCSDSITSPNTISTNVTLSNISGLRLSISGSTSGNTRLGLVSITLK